MQAAAATDFHHYFQLIYHKCHELVCLGLRLRSFGTTTGDATTVAIEDWRWAIEDRILLTLLAIEGMLSGAWR